MSKKRRKRRKRCSKDAKWTVWPSHKSNDGYHNHEQSCTEHLSDLVKDCKHGAFVYTDCYGGPCNWRSG